MTKQLTAALTVLKAAGTLDGGVGNSFTEFDLTMAAWRLNPLRFGLRGYQHKHPDHKRVATEYAGDRRSSPIKRGYMIRLSPCVYQLTALGRSVAASIGKEEQILPLIAWMGGVINHSCVGVWVNDPARPHDIRDVQSLLDRDTFEQFEQRANEAFEWCRTQGLEYLAVPYHGGRIHFPVIVTVLDFLSAMRARFPKLTGKKTSRDK